MADKLFIEGAKVTDKGVELKQSAGGKEYALLTVMWSSSRKDRQSGQREFGPTKFLKVMAFGWQAGDIAANVNAGDRVNIIGSIEHFEWQSNQGPKDDWTVFADSVMLPVPRAGSHERMVAANQGGAPAAAPTGNPWGSGPQGGFGSAQDQDEPPF